MNWIFNKGLELKPTFGQAYVNASGYNDQREEIYYTNSPNIREKINKDGLKINIEVVSSLSDFTELYKFFDITEYVFLKFIANDKNNMDKILRFLYKNINGYTMICNIYLAKKEATLEHHSKSKNVSRPISKVILGHHIILCVPMKTHVYNSVNAKKALISLINRNDRGHFVNHFLQDSIAFIDYTDIVKKPAFQILNELKIYPYKNYFSLFVEMPKLDKLSGFSSFHTEIKTLPAILKLKQLNYLMEEKFSLAFNMNDVEKTINIDERAKIAVALMINIKTVGLEVKSFPQPQLIVLYRYIKVYEKEFCLSVYENIFIPVMQPDFEEHIDVAYHIINKLPIQRSGNLWLIKANDENAKIIYQEYLAGKWCVLMTKRTEDIVEKFFNDTVVWVLTEETKWEDLDEPMTIFNGDDEYLIGMITPQTFNGDTAKNGIVYRFPCCCEHDKGISKAWICTVCKSFYRIVDDNHIYCDCGVYNVAEIKKECFKCAVTPLLFDEEIIAKELKKLEKMLNNGNNIIIKVLLTYILRKILQISTRSKFDFEKKLSAEIMSDSHDEKFNKTLKLCKKQVADPNILLFIENLVEIYDESETKHKMLETLTFKEEEEELKERSERNLSGIDANEKLTPTVSPRPLISDNHNVFAFPKQIIDIDQNINAVGIDLGTSRCCVAVNRKSGIETVALENTGERLLPSYVAYDEEHTKCGQIVIDRLRYFSEATVFDSKRFIGKSIVTVDKMWPFKVVNINNQAVIKLKAERGEIQQTATEVAAVLLKYMKEKAEQFQGKKLSNVVITVPAAFSIAQEEETKEAAVLAGWEYVTLLPEPIAAAFAYFIDRPIPNNSNVLLFDLGGGTLDVCIFKIINDHIQIISKNGDLKLGGRDFDNLLMDYFSNKLDLDYDISKLGINIQNFDGDNSCSNQSFENQISKLKNKKFKLLMECQKIKHNLSVRNEDQLDAGDIDLALNGFIKITQQNFKDLAEDLINKIQNTIFSTLYKSGFKADQIDKVLQVGGGCRMPMIKELLQGIFPSAEQCSEEHPDEVVAIGAAYYAYHIFSS